MITQQLDFATFLGIPSEFPLACFLSFWRTLFLKLRFEFVGFSTLVSSFNLSFNSRRSIFPLKDFGISSMNLTPPRSFLYGATFSSTNISTSFSVSDASALRTTNAIGNSPTSKFGTPITAASSMSGCETRRASSSAGGTYEGSY